MTINPELWGWSTEPLSIGLWGWTETTAPGTAAAKVPSKSRAFYFSPAPVRAPLTNTGASYHGYKPGTRRGSAYE